MKVPNLVLYSYTTYSYFLFANNVFCYHYYIKFRNKHLVTNLGINNGIGLIYICSASFFETAMINIWTFGGCAILYFCLLYKAIT